MLVIHSIFIFGYFKKIYRLGIGIQICFIVEHKNIKNWFLKLCVTSI